MFQDLNYELERRVEIELHDALPLQKGSLILPSGILDQIVASNSFTYWVLRLTSNQFPVFESRGLPFLWTIGFHPALR